MIGLVIIGLWALAVLIARQITLNSTPNYCRKHTSKSIGILNVVSGTFMTILMLTYWSK